MTLNGGGSPPRDMKYILVTDVGSTTTIARFFAKKEEEWRYVISGEARAINVKICEKNQLDVQKT